MCGCVHSCHGVTDFTSVSVTSRCISERCTVSLKVIVKVGVSVCVCGPGVCVRMRPGVIT